uniref:G-type lectin S-receptor-like serine/threonine-protein kinase n=1 Tax=Populus alba TaxID=43335 RepID=A0A4V6AAV4_POPAL|nr:G-type lectin S-receptor-like serine/threonine-protein kinase [Populus alba]
MSRTTYSSSSSYPNDFDQFPKDVSNEVDTFNSSMRWAIASSIVLGLVSTVALVAIIYAIIDCLKKTGSAIPAYARIATNEIVGKSTKSEGPNPSSDQHVEIAVEPEFPLIRDSQVEFATMERFLSNMAREKPIRFSPQQIHEFTNGCSTILGSGAFGVVFKGNFPNGIPVAVKALSNHSNKKLEEQFMAEVGTMGRTYHVNLWLPRWVWDMYRNRELPIMLSLCGIEEKDKEKAVRMSTVALLCIQYSPDARPQMSDVVKMLEGNMEIMTQPGNPFEYLESTRPIYALDTGSSCGDMSTSVSRTSASQQSHCKHNLPGTLEIELASKY